MRRLRFAIDAIVAAPYCSGRMRLGATSFVYRAGWLENVVRLRARVRDVELLFFDADELPCAQELTGLVAERRRGDLSYTVHTPLSASLASEDSARRRDGIEQVLRVIDALACVDPLAFIVHVYCGEQEHGARPADLDAFRARAFESLRALLDRGVPASQLCVESLDYDLAEIAPVVDALDVSYALDVGHWHRDGRSLTEQLARYLPRTRVIQWHGTDPDARDHRSLAHYPQASARALLRALRDARYEGVLTLEVFREDDFEESLKLALQWLAHTEQA